MHKLMQHKLQTTLEPTEDRDKVELCYVCNHTFKSSRHLPNQANDLLIEPFQWLRVVE